MEESVKFMFGKEVDSMVALISSGEVSMRTAKCMYVVGGIVVVGELFWMLGVWRMFW